MPMPPRNVDNDSPQLSSVPTNLQMSASSANDNNHDEDILDTPKLVPLAANHSDNNEYVTECAGTWSVLGFLMSLLYTVVHVPFAQVRDVIWTMFYEWIVLLIGVTAMAILFALKQRRRYLGYKALLYCQYGLFQFASEILFIVGSDFEPDKIFDSMVRGIITIPVSVFAMRVRS